MVIFCEKMNFLQTKYIYLLLDFCMFFFHFIIHIILYGKIVILQITVEADLKFTTVCKGVAALAYNWQLSLLRYLLKSRCSFLKKLLKNIIWVKRTKWVSLFFFLFISQNLFHISYLFWLLSPVTSKYCTERNV